MIVMWAPYVLNDKKISVSEDGVCKWAFFQCIKQPGLKHALAIEDVFYKAVHCNTWGSAIKLSLYTNIFQFSS